MTNVASVVPSAPPTRCFPELARPAPLRVLATEPEILAERGEAVWDVLGQVFRQQLSHDALLLWQPGPQPGPWRLMALTPGGPAGNQEIVTPTPALLDLAAGQLEALAHVHCAHSVCPFEQTLWRLGLHSGITAALGDPAAPLLLTVGFRERWQLVAHHTSAVAALAHYLRECRAAGLPLTGDARWWAAGCYVAHLWRQPCRPSVVRTVHDLNEVLLDLADQCRPAPPTADVAALIGRLAHKAGDLMARLESVYWDSRPVVTCEEILSEALLVVRGAYQLCSGAWPGCLAAVSFAPQPAATSPAALRHEMIDWVLTQVLSEQEALGA